MLIYRILLITLILLILYILYKTLSIRQFYKINALLIIVAMITEAVDQVIVYGDPIYTKVPLDLCNLAGIAVAVTLLTTNKRLAKLSFFISLGVYAALLTPDDAGLFKLDLISFICFYVKHLVILLGLYIFIYKEKITVSLKDLTYSIYFIAFFSIFNLGYNHFAGTNFMYVSHVPEFDSPLSYIGTGIQYKIIFSLIVLTCLITVYIIYCLINKIKIIRYE